MSTATRPLHRDACTRAALRRRARHSQAGFSLLEVIIAVFLISLVIAGLATAFITMVRTNGSTAAQQRVDHAINDVTETLKAANYEACVAGTQPPVGDRAAVYAPVTPTDINGVALEIVDVGYRDTPDERFTDRCPAAGDAGTQLITVRGEYRDHSRNAQIVLRAR